MSLDRMRTTLFQPIVIGVAVVLVQCLPLHPALAVAAASEAPSASPAARVAQAGDRLAKKDASLAFTFKLDDAATTSAGVYSEGALVKTLWSNVRYPAGSHTATWDGTTDDGGVATPGSYTIKILSSKVKYVWEGVVGNTSDAFTGPTLHHAEDIIHGMAVSGTNLYIAAGYNEARSSTFKMNVANPQKKMNILPTPFAHGYTDAVTRFVATDGRYVYWAGCVADLAPSNHFVYATKTSDDLAVEFHSGEVINISGNLIKRSVIDHLEATNAISTGLAVQKDGPYLFVSHCGLNAVHVLDKTTGARVTAVTLGEPSSLAVDGGDNLWVATIHDGRPSVQKYAVAKDGTLSPIKGLEIAGLLNPLALAVSPDNKTLLVADGGASQQLRAFDNASATPKWVFGEAGGYAAAPTVANDKFFFRNVDNINRVHGGFEWTWLAWQPDGSFWVGDCGNYRAQRYAANRTFKSRIMWIPMFYTALVDLNDPSRVFADFLEFRIDYSKPLGADNGSWKLVRNWGATEPPADYTYTGGYYRRAKFPFLTVATLSNGRTYATFRNFISSKLGLAELDPSRGLRFTGVETPGLYSSLAADGSLRTSSQATAGRPLTWSIQPLSGFDSLNNPQWPSQKTVATSPPVERQVFDHAPFDSGLPIAWEISKSGIIPSFDAMAPLPAYESHPVSHTGWHLAGLDAKAGTWRWKAAPSTARNYHGDWPTDGAFDIGNGVGNAGGYAHVLGDNIFWQYIGEGWKGGEAAEVNMWTHLRDDGLMVGQFGVVQHIMPDGKEDEGQPGMAGNATSHGIVRLRNGVIYIYHNDEGFHGGVHRWRIDDLASIRAQEVPVTWDGSVAPKPKDPTDLLAGLPRQSAVADGVAGWHRSPAEDSLKDQNLDWWRVRTSITTYRKDDSPDIDIGFAHRPAGTATVTRDLGTPATPLAEWTLTTTLRFGWLNIAASEGLDIEILDGADKVIVRLSPTQVDSGNYRFLANGQPLFRSSDMATFTSMIRSLQPLTIHASSGSLTIAYGTQAPVNATVFDPESNWRMPKVLKVRAWSTYGGYNYSVNFRNLNFYSEN